MFPFILTPKTCGHVTLYGIGDFADVIKLTIKKSGAHPGLSNLITRGRQEGSSQRQLYDDRSKGREGYVTMEGV